MDHGHHAAAAAAAAAVTGVHSAGRQLLQAQYMLASWVERHERVAGRGAPLPAPLDHGPVELLQRVLAQTDSPYASAKLLDDAVILLMYGASFLQDRYDETRGRERIESCQRNYNETREQWKTKAQQIQASWRTQRFHTNRLRVLSLDTSSFLLPEVEDLMRRKKLQPQDSIENLGAVPVQVNEKELEKQVVNYAAELKKRVEARRRDEDELQRKQLKDQRVQEERRKRMIVQRKKRHEHACRRWNYFTTRLLRIARQKDENAGHTTPDPIAPSDSNRHLVSGTSKKNLDRSRSMLRAFKNPAQRVFVRRFVAKVIARAVSRMLCAYNMGQGGLGVYLSSDPAAIAADYSDATMSNNPDVVRLGLLLCDLHFGEKYMGLYQRFFDKAAQERGIRVEWHVFNCIKSHFPTKAHSRVLNGYLVAGGPNIGTINDSPLADEDIDSEARRRNHSGSKKNRHFGRWRYRLLTMLRELYSRKQVLLGGMGLGHIILAEALGARIGMREWEDGWCLLDPTIFGSEANPHALDRRLGQGMVGVRFLHGEFVESFGNEKNRQGFKVWRSPGEHNFVAGFRDSFTLSIDGSPECGPFVFETLGEFYDRDKLMRARQSEASETTGTRKNQPSGVSDDDDDDEEDNLQPTALFTAPSLEEKRKRMGITDASERVANLFLDHFQRHISMPAAFTGSFRAGGRMSITGVVCSSGILQVDDSLRHLVGMSGIDGTLVNVSTTTDGHLVVTNPRAFAMIVDHDKRIKDICNKQRQPAGALSSQSGARRNSVFRPPTLTLSMIRSHDQALQRAVSPSVSNQVSPRIVRLPSIRQDGSTHSLTEMATNNANARESVRGLVRRTSTLAASRVAQVLNQDAVSVRTLSQALSCVTKGAAQSGPVRSRPKRVYIRLLDEECKQTHALLPITKAELRTAWLRLTAAIRIAQLGNDQIAIVSRHSLVLNYVKRRRPTWTFVKDCRRSDVTHRTRVKNVAQYAAYADIVLFDKDFLLSNSASENDVLLRKAHSFGLEVYVAPRDESPKVENKQDEKVSPKRKASLLPKKSSRSKRSLLMQEIGDKATEGGNAEYDMQVVEFMLLQLSGLDGVITAHPEAAVDAQLRIAAKSEAMQQVEQLFRDWQDKDNTKASSPKRTSNTPPQTDPSLDEQDPADYVGGDSGYESDESLPEHEVVEEMARQLAEHSNTGALEATTALSGLSGGLLSASPIVRSSSPMPMAAAPFLPLRPLQQKTGDEVFGAAAIRRQNANRHLTLSSSSGSESRGRLSSIGSFRAAVRRSSGSVASPPQFDSMRAIPRIDESDPRLELRSPEMLSPMEVTATPPPASTRSLQPRSTRKSLLVPR